MSDTHGLCDKKIEKYLSDCDEIWHAGDIGSLEVVNKLRSFAPLRAVYGNIDDLNIRHEFSEFLSFDCEGSQLSSYLCFHIFDCFIKCLVCKVSFKKINNKTS